MTMRKRKQWTIIKRKPVTKAENMPCSLPPVMGVLELKYWDNLQSVRKLDFRDTGESGCKDSYKDAT